METASPNTEPLLGVLEGVWGEFDSKCHSVLVAPLVAPHVESAFKAAEALSVAIEEIRRLRKAIHEHRSQRADDRCIDDDDRLYESLRDGIKCDRRVGDKTEMLRNCARFIDRRCENGGPWKTYEALEAEIAELRAATVNEVENKPRRLWVIHNRIDEENHEWIQVVVGAGQAMVGIGTIGGWLDECPGFTSLCVHPDYRRQGIGELIVRTCVDKCREAGKVALTLQVFKSNTVAVAVYKKVGFQVYTDSKEHYWMSLPFEK